MTDNVSDFDLPDEDIALLLHDVPTSEVPLNTIINKEDQLSIFNGESNLEAFSTLGGVADLALQLKNSDIGAFQESGNRLFSQLSDALLPRE